MKRKRRSGVCTCYAHPREKTKNRATFGQESDTAFQNFAVQKSCGLRKFINLHKSKKMNLKTKDALEESFDAQNLSDDEAEFFSDNNINEISHLKSIGKKLTGKKKDPFFMRSIKKTKHFMRQMNLQTEQKSIPHIAEHIGQPIWLASYVAELEGEDMMNFVPIVPTDEALINGVLIYRNTTDGETSYSLTTREQMAAVETETDDQNYPLLVQMFYEFDKQLFEAEIEEYTEWGNKTVIELEDCSRFPEYTCAGRMTQSPNQVITLFDESVFGTTPLSGFGTEFPCYYACGAGCTADIYASGIADTEEEITWMNGNCHYADVVDDFLGKNDISDIAITEAGQVLFNIGMAGVLTSQQLRRLANALDAFFEDPDSEANAEDLYIALHGLNIDILSLSIFNLTANTLPAFNVPFFDNWEDMNSGNFFGFTGHIRDFLKETYPHRESKINSFFTCRVMGLGQEDGALESLGLLGTTIPPNDPDFTKRPDGFTQNVVLDDDEPHLQPIIIESKGKYGGWGPGGIPEFDYSNQIPQFDGYREYLKKPLNTHEPLCSAAHGLYMILPANVSLTDNIITACSNDNIPLFYSGMEYDADYPDTFVQARVKYPQLLNIGELNYSCHEFSFIGDIAMKWALQRVHFKEFYMIGIIMTK